jgi:hypothetical protein
MTGTRPLGLGDADLDDAMMLFMRQRRALAGRADRDEAVRAVGDLPVDMGAERRLVKRAVLERRDQRGHRALESGFRGHIYRPASVGDAKRPEMAAFAGCLEA